MYIEVKPYIGQVVNSKHGLMRMGLQTRTPPSFCARRLPLDENSPLIPSPSGYTLIVRQKPLHDESDNSQDSSFCDASSSAFRFTEPNSKPAKKISPRRCLKFSSCDSFSRDSGISEDGFSDILNNDDEPFCTVGSSNFGSLFNFTEQLPTPKSRKRPCFSPNHPSGKKVKPLRDRASTENKRGTLFEYGFTRKAKPEGKEVTDKEENHIKLALQRSTQEELIGDFSRPFALPLTPGKHQDLKAITCETLASLINGEFKERIASFKIIDCRYPYEFEGGHVRGAYNLFSCEHILKDLLRQAPKQPQDSNKRNILIFHCEFSSERGPFLSRFLRKEDRASHEYPHLAFPECYLLHGGYKAFFALYKDLCVPQSYRTMEDPAHQSDLKHFKAKSKSWAPGHYRKMTVRSLSRLGF